LICLEYLSMLIRFWICINIDMTPNSINTNITPSSINTDRTPIYQLDTSWIFIHADKTPKRINLICIGVISMLIVLDIYQHW
jgi:hypothetical protein